MKNLLATIVSTAICFSALANMPINGAGHTFSEITPQGEEPPVFYSVETMPSFEGADITHFQSWVMSQVRYPQVAAENGIQGRVVVEFVIDETGRLIDPQIKRSPDKVLSDEVLRILALSPRWSPGKQRSTPVRVKFTLPVDFRLN